MSISTDEWSDIAALINKPKKKRDSKKVGYRLAVIDAETDPFKFGREPEVFVWGFYDGEIYKQFWGDDATDQLIDYLKSRKDPLKIYAHNGGKFDFMYLLKKGIFENPALIIHGRITQVRILKNHILRDSFSIIPVPLAKIGNKDIGEKLDIDYDKMERHCREEYRDEICTYLKQDCVVLYNAVDAFQKRFGDKLTIASVAHAEINKQHPIYKQNSGHDKTFRPFYYGGRVQCFVSGRLRGDFELYDVNSMYPSAMKDYIHPQGSHYITLKGKDAEKVFDHKTGKLKGYGGMYFIRMIAENKNALPRRMVEWKGKDKDKLVFDCPYGEFNAISHEVHASCELKLIKVHKILEIKIPCSYFHSTEFITEHAIAKAKAKDTGDFMTELFEKLLMNSGYGRYGIDPGDFKEWFILDTFGDTTHLNEFEAWRDQYTYEDENGTQQCDAFLESDNNSVEIWSAPAPNENGYIDVAIAASITSAARAILLRAIVGCKRPIYCDTDSLWCHRIGNVVIHDTQLGAWKFEGSTNELWIAGKKMYSAILNELETKGKNIGKPKIKIASKGAKLKHQDIVDMVNGKVIYWQNDAPNFKFNGQTKFVARNVRFNA